MKHPFSVDHLDHVAIRVKDPQASIEWYSKVLGLRALHVDDWGEFPVFLLAGRTGIALFPAHLEDAEHPRESLNVQIEHFAFHVSNEEFVKARAHYENLGIDYRFRDHTHFYSIYTRDPDGHEVELTTLLTEGLYEV
jgi:catechol 2,3-dioxygenase-like lactoylglutathione lyase family enzyme